jgi:hypothetical protein
MDTVKKNSLPPDFCNPFKGRDKAEVWREIDQYLRPISREEMLRQMREQAQRKQKDQDTPQP